MIGEYHDCFYVMRSSCIFPPPIESILNVKLFVINQIPFTIAAIFKIDSGILNRVRQNITLKIFKLIFYWSPTQPVLIGNLSFYLQNIHHNGSQLYWISTDTTILSWQTSNTVPCLAFHIRPQPGSEPGKW